MDNQLPTALPPSPAASPAADAQEQQQQQQVQPPAVVAPPPAYDFVDAKPDPQAAAAASPAPPAALPTPQQSPTKRGWMSNLLGSRPARSQRSRGVSGVKPGVDRSSAVVPPIDVDKPSDPKHTVVAMVVDRSGSMQSMGAEVEGGCNAYLDEQRAADAADPGAKTTVLLTTFDSTIDRVIDWVSLTDIPPITHAQVEPRGMTALYDGIGETLQSTATFVNNLPTRPSVVVFILTDGQENSSQTWTKAAVTAEIKKLQAEPIGWDFYFAAANQDALAEGSKLGMDSAQCMQWSPEGAKMKSAFRSANVAYQRKKMGGPSGYTMEERASCM